jgi:peptide/nickel transport system substrate-binding protein
MVAAKLRGVLIAVTTATLLLSACTAPNQQSPSGQGPGGATLAESQRRSPKILTIGVREEPSDFGSFTATSGIRGSSNATVIVNNALTMLDEREAVRPQLAVAIPAIENGTWRVQPDGTMEVTWKIHPNVKWHDGTPFTSADLLFSFEVYKDPEISNRRGIGVPLMESATAPDPHTFVIKWSKAYVEANRGDEVLPMPRHLLEELYRSDKDAFINSRYFTTEFMGLGPYRMTRWETSQFLEFERFDDYFRGRPPLDRVILKFIPDPNTMLANILSGAVDIVLPPNVDIDSMSEIRQRWEGTGNVARADSTGRFRLMDPQHRVEYARPRQFGTTDRTVRQALYTAIDRKTMAEVLSQGIAPFADSWIPPDHALRSDIESAVPQFNYDPARAKQLLEQAGWRAGGDGVLVHPQTGESFDLVLRLALSQGASAGKEKEANIIRDNWQQVGVRVQIDQVPSARAGDRQYEATVPGLSLTGNLTPERWYTERTYSKIIASDANRWSGTNKAGYSNPRVDTILEGLQATIDPRERINLHRQLLQEQMGDVALMPLYWEYAPIFMLKGVKDSVVGARTGYRFFEWDKES